MLPLKEKNCHFTPQFIRFTAYSLSAGCFFCSNSIKQIIMKKNNPFNSTMLAALIGAATIFSSCKKDDDPTPVATNTITDVVVNNASYSVLKEAVVKAGLDTTLKGTGPFTVFAPDNAAFANANITSATVASLSSAQLSSLLLYHTIGAKILAANVPAGPNAKVVTAGGDSVFVTKNAAGVFVNGISVAQADIPADNGVIHRLSKALNKPSGNIVATAQAAGSNLDSLVKAIVRVNNAPAGTPGANPNLINLLSTGTLTVFAPTNAAFTQLMGALGVTDINQISVANLAAVLTYHVVSGRAFSSDLVAGNLTMFAGGTTTIGLTGTPTIKGNNLALAVSIGGSTNNTCNIVSTNVMARNGVVHVIDRVLLP
jgi:uncharacterized surface protein with fasciclin (FAS1) repeats